MQHCAHLTTHLHDLAEGPHEGAVHAHELLLVHLVALVQHHPHFVVVPLQRLDHLLELICTTETRLLDETTFAW